MFIHPLPANSNPTVVKDHRLLWVLPPHYSCILLVTNEIHMWACGEAASESDLSDIDFMKAFGEAQNAPSTTTAALLED